MKRILPVLLLLFSVAASAAPVFPVNLDLQAQNRQFQSRWAAGSAPTLEARVYDGGAAYTNLAGWTGQVYVAVTTTSGVFVSSSGSSSNAVSFPFAAAQCATVGAFQAYVILGDGTQVYQWGAGTLTWTDSPGLLGAGPIPTGVPLNWDLYTFTGTMPAQAASYTNPLSGDVTGTPDATEIMSGVVGTNEIDATVRGQIASASATGAEAYVRAEAAHTLAASAYGPTNPPPASGLATNDPAWSNLVTGIEAAGSAAAAAHFDATRFHEHEYEGPAATNYVELFHSFGSPGTRSAGIRYGYSDGAPLWGSVAAVYLYGNVLVSNLVYVGNPQAPPYPNLSTNQLTVQGGVAAGWFFTHSGATFTSNGASRLAGYVPTDFIFASSLSNYFRDTTSSGAVTSNSASGTKGEFRRIGTNAYFHNGGGWITWGVVTNFSH